MLRSKLEEFIFHWLLAEFLTEKLYSFTRIFRQIVNTATVENNAFKHLRQALTLLYFLLYLSFNWSS